jgi:DTW domain-containing protein YfiP
MQDGLCICSALPHFTLRTRVSLVVHHREWPRTTNTGHLALRSLSNASVALWGEEGQEIPEPESIVPPGTVGYALAPSGLPLDAARAEELRAGPPVTLVVADGSWRQATKMNRRVPALSVLPRLALPPGPPSVYQLRVEPFEHGLATFEAIARALGILEGRDVQAALEQAFRLMVQRTLITRGRPSAVEL